MYDYLYELNGLNNIFIRVINALGMLFTGPNKRLSVNLSGAASLFVSTAVLSEYILLNKLLIYFTVTFKSVNSKHFILSLYIIFLFHLLILILYHTLKLDF